MQKRNFKIKKGTLNCTGSYYNYYYYDRINPSKPEYENYLKFGSGKIKEFKTYDSAMAFVQAHIHTTQQTDIKIVECVETDADPIDFSKMEIIKTLVSKYDSGILSLIFKLTDKPDGQDYKHILIIPFKTYKDNQKKIRGLEVKKTDFIQTSSQKNAYWAFKDPDKLMLVRLALNCNHSVEIFE